MSYFRPLVQSGAVRSEGALPLAGGAHWFTHVERLERGGAAEVLPAAALPEGWRQALTAPRPDYAGLAMDRPHVMGILNATPDSFSDGGLHAEAGAATRAGRAMYAAGATLLDIGGESTRPGAEEVPVPEEIARVVPVLEGFNGQGVLSLDTRKAAVARAGLAAGATLINDVSGFTFDPALAEVAAEAGAAVCIMHTQGTPDHMQDAPHYDDVLLDVYDHLAERISALEAVGVSRAQISIDPGIGFGKTLSHNLALLKGLSLFHGLGVPLLLGVSRKRFIGTLGHAPDPAARAPGSIAVALAGVAQGAQILRVHDVAETLQALRLWQAVTGGVDLDQG